MRTAFWFIVAIVAAHLNVARSRHQLSNERSSLDSSENTQQDQLGFAFGTSRKPITTFYSIETPIFWIPSLMWAVDNETVPLPPLDVPDNAMYVNIDDSQIGNQTAWLNGFELSNFTFHLDEYALGSVEVGLALIGTQLIFDNTPSSGYMHNSVLDSLFESGAIETRSFALTVDSNFDVLFGEIDHGKYDGPLVKFRHFYEESQDDQFTIHPTLLMDGMAGTNFSVYNPVLMQLWGSWSLPDDYYYTLFNYFKQNYDMDDDGYMPCSIFNSTEYVSFYLSGEEFQYPMSSLASFTYDNGSMYSYSFDSDYYNESATCIFSPDQSDNFGIPMDLFYGRYLVVDYDNEEIGIARIATKSNPQTIEIISTGILSATPAKYFSFSSSVSTTTESDGWEDYSTLYHPTYSMYTGGHFGLNQTESSYTTVTDSSTLSKSVASTTAFSHAGSTKSDHSTKKGSSSSSKAAGNTQTTGGIFAFVTFFLSALMIL